MSANGAETVFHFYSFLWKQAATKNINQTQTVRETERGKNGAAVDGAGLRRGGRGFVSSYRNVAVAKAREISDHLSSITYPPSPRRRHPLRRFPAARLVS